MDFIIPLPKIKFDGKNWDEQVYEVEFTLISINAYYLVIGIEPAPTSEEDLENWDKRNKLAGAFLKYCVTEDVFQEIKYYKDGTKIWKILKTLYKNSG